MTLHTIGLALRISDAHISEFAASIDFPGGYRLPKNDAF